MARRKPPALDIVALLPSWELSLRAERKSPQTIKSYGDGVRAFLRWCDERGHSPLLDRDLMKGFVADLLEAGADLRTIQLLLGHRDLKETSIYLHLSSRHLHATASPLDSLPLFDQPANGLRTE